MEHLRFLARVVLWCGAGVLLLSGLIVALEAGLRGEDDEPR